MSSGLVSCPRCQVPLAPAECNTPAPIHCLSCRTIIYVEVFPARVRPRSEVRPAESVLESGVTSCFYHDGKKAVLPCDDCGRFLCALCEIELNGQHLCPSCIDRSRTKGGLANLENSRKDYARASFLTFVIPLMLFFLFPIWLLTGPVAIGLGIFSFFRPGSIVGPRRWRAVVGIVGGAVQIVLALVLMATTKLHLY